AADQGGIGRVTRFRYYNHMPLLKIAKRYGEPIDGFTVMCVERRPYDKVMSLVKWRMSRKAYTRGESRDLDADTLRAHLKKLWDRDMVEQVKNIDAYRDANGRLPQIVIHTENLNAEFAAAMEKLGVQNAPELPYMKKTSELALEPT